MLTFFRRIRKGLLGSGATSKYLLYAIGEIALVVIGILVALQINNWNEDRRDREKEQLILLQLKKDYQSNLKQLDEKILMRNEMIETSIKILGYIDAPDNVHIDSLIPLLTTISLIPTFDPVSNDLISSGNLRLVRNESLKRLLSAWTSEVVQVWEEEEYWVELRNNITVPFLIKQGLARDAHHHFNKNQGSKIFQIDKNIKSEIYIGSSNKKLRVDSILDNRELEGILSSTIISIQSANLQSHALRDRILKIIQLLTSEIIE